MWSVQVACNYSINSSFPCLLTTVNFDARGFLLFLCNIHFISSMITTTEASLSYLPHSSWIISFVCMQFSLHSIGQFSKVKTIPVKNLELFLSVNCCLISKFCTSNNIDKCDERLIICKLKAIHDNWTGHIPGLEAG